MTTLGSGFRLERHFFCRLGRIPSSRDTETDHQVLANASLRTGKRETSVDMTTPFLCWNPKATSSKKRLATSRKKIKELVIQSC